MRLATSITQPSHPNTERSAGAPSASLARRALAFTRAHCRANDALRIGFGLIWAVDAAFKWQSGFRQGFMGMVMGLGQGQPGWMHGWFQF